MIFLKSQELINFVFILIFLRKNYLKVKHPKTIVVVKENDLYQFVTECIGWFCPNNFCQCWLYQFFHKFKLTFETSLMTRNDQNLREI